MYKTVIIEVEGGMVQNCYCLNTDIDIVIVDRDILQEEDISISKEVEDVMKKSNVIY